MGMFKSKAQKSREAYDNGYLWAIREILAEESSIDEIESEALWSDSPFDKGAIDAVRDLEYFRSNYE